MFDFINITKALSDENRVRILMALRGKELCVCTLTELLDLAPSTTSKHLSVLKQARLIESVKDGKFVYYRLATESPHGADLAEPTLHWLENSLEKCPQVETDAARLAKIIEAGEQLGTDSCVATKNHKLYRHVPGIHAIGDFGEQKK